MLRAGGVQAAWAEKAPPAACELASEPRPPAVRGGCAPHISRWRVQLPGRSCRTPAAPPRPAPPVPGAAVSASGETAPVNV